MTCAKLLYWRWVFPKSTSGQVPLPAVAVEISEVAQKLWSQGKGFLDEEFTLDKLKALTQEQRYGIIHLATHAEFQKGKQDKIVYSILGRKNCLLTSCGSTLANQAGIKAPR